MYRQASRESRDGSTMGTARAETRGREPARTLVRLLPETGAPAGLPCTDDRTRLIYVPGGEAPGCPAFDFSQMVMPAGCSIAVRSRQRTGAAVVIDLDALPSLDSGKRAKVAVERTDHKLVGSDPRPRDPRYPRWARASSWSKPAASSPGSWSKSGTRMAGRRPSPR